MSRSSPCASQLAKRAEPVQQRVGLRHEPCSPPCAAYEAHLFECAEVPAHSTRRLPHVCCDLSARQIAVEPQLAQHSHTIRVSESTDERRISGLRAVPPIEHATDASNDVVARTPNYGSGA